MCSSSGIISGGICGRVLCRSEYRGSASLIPLQPSMGTSPSGCGPVRPGIQILNELFQASVWLPEAFLLCFLLLWPHFLFCTNPSLPFPSSQPQQRYQHVPRALQGCRALGKRPGVGKVLVVEMISRKTGFPFKEFIIQHSRQRTAQNGVSGETMSTGSRAQEGRKRASGTKGLENMSPSDATEPGPAEPGGLQQLQKGGWPLASLCSQGAPLSCMALALYFKLILS